MFDEKETQEVAKEIQDHSHSPCSDCDIERRQCGMTEDEWIDEDCATCEIVVALDPEDLTWTIDHYQYLQHITGMVILPIPVDAEEIIDAVAEYKEYKKTYRDNDRTRCKPF